MADQRARIEGAEPVATDHEYRDGVVARARKLVGTPWQRRGRTVSGTDCAGVAFQTGHDCDAFDTSWDIKDVRFAVQGGIWGPWPGCTRVPQKEKRPGDILILAKTAVGKRARQPYYCGVLGSRRRELTIIAAFPGEAVAERSLKELLAGRPLLGVVHRIAYPPKRGKQLAPPERSRQDRNPEVITCP